MKEFIETKILTPEFYDTYIPYGNLDNIVVILGSLLGHKVEKYIPQKLQSGLGAVWGGGIANAFSDFGGGMITLSYDLAFGTAIGCLMALILIPIVVYIGRLINGEMKWFQKLH